MQCSNEALQIVNSRETWSQCYETLLIKRLNNCLWNSDFSLNNETHIGLTPCQILPSRAWCDKLIVAARDVDVVEGRGQREADDRQEEVELEHHLKHFRPQPRAEEVGFYSRLDHRRILCWKLEEKIENTFSFLNYVQKVKRFFVR